MDVYTVDTNYNRDKIVEDFESFIWTERYAEHGDFVLKAAPTSKLKTYLPVDTMITHSETSQVMFVLSVLEEMVDGTASLSITGKSLTTLMETRTIKPNWKATGPIGNLVANLIRSICVDGNGVSPNDVIPELAVYNNTGETEAAEVSFDFGSLYDVVTQLADTVNVGFYIYRRSTSPRIAFNIYKGVERPNTVFSTELDTLINPSSLISNESYYNIAYVNGVNGITVVAATGVSANIQGLKRRVLAVDASDVNPEEYTAEAYKSLLIQKGKQALAEHKQVTVFDGEIPEDAKSKYGIDYNLGDIVFFKGDGNKVQKVRITEYIWSLDSNGETSYPSFTQLDEE